MPAPRPVASDEQLTLGIARSILALKFVQPLNCRYDVGAGSVSSVWVTELTMITCGYDEGQLLCWAASSAAGAVIVTPWPHAESVARRAKAALFSVASASWTTDTGLSTA